MHHNVIESVQRGRHFGFVDRWTNWALGARIRANSPSRHGSWNSMLFPCWSSVVDAGPALKQHQVKVSCLLDGGGGGGGLNNTTGSGYPSYKLTPRQEGCLIPQRRSRHFALDLRPAIGRDTNLDQSQSLDPGGGWLSHFWCFSGSQAVT